MNNFRSKKKCGIFSPFHILSTDANKTDWLHL